MTDVTMIVGAATAMMALPSPIYAKHTAQGFSVLYLKFLKEGKKNEVKKSNEV